MSLDIGLFIAAATAIVSVLGWYRSQVRTSYSHEREYLHISRNLEQAAIAHQDIFKEVDQINDRLSRLEILLIKEAK